MKRVDMYAEERQQAIAALVTRDGRVSVNDLADDFNVTTETVRRDLAALSRSGLVRRVHGGAVPARTLISFEVDEAERSAQQSAEKDRIAKAALAFLPKSGGSVLFDAGTTTGRMASLMPNDVPLTAATHSLPIAATLLSLPTISLQLIGGQVRSLTQAAVGADAVAAISALKVDVAFVGTNGISIEHGLSTPDAAEAAVKQAIVRAAKTVVVVADSSKVNTETLRSFASFDEADVLVTDSGISKEALRQYRAQGLEVVVA
ncbi:DeoR/GlpR family DNA-binding transcription regulator [Smaragdicoccus niigatensis]